MQKIACPAGWPLILTQRPNPALGPERNASCGFTPLRLIHLRLYANILALTELPRIWVLDPFHAGSHAVLTHRLTTGLQAHWHMLTLPGRHWKWRMRGAAVHFAAQASRSPSAPADLLFTTSMLALSDFKALMPDWAAVPSLLYFHENQLAYPDRGNQVRDHHFGFTQLVSARVATACAFNSQFNLDSFLAEGAHLLGALPDAVPAGWIEGIAKKSRVLPVPLALSEVAVAGRPASASPGDSRGPMILWNHRWEHDKHPEAFFEALCRLDERGRPFRLAMAGPRFERWPRCFDDARARWPHRVVQFGPCTHRDEYEALLLEADLAISTAGHEFFGISMVEAAHFGAFVLVPDRLAYPEIFPAEYRYRDDTDLVERLVVLVDRWMSGAALRGDRRSITARFGDPALRSFAEVLTELSGGPVRVREAR